MPLRPDAQRIGAGRRVEEERLRFRVVDDGHKEKRKPGAA
jgi:hypothetical protein